MSRKYTVKDLAGNIVFEWDIEFDDGDELAEQEVIDIAYEMIFITEAAERIGAKAELVTSGEQLADREIEEGTDTGLGAQLQDAGFGSGGVM